MLNAVREALSGTLKTDQDSDQDSDQVVRLLRLFEGKPLSAAEMMQRLWLSHRPTFRNNYLHPAVDKWFIEMTVPEKQKSRLQKYRITRKGMALRRE